jgi:glycosyltransferase involved in cell wall biosynthesis
MGKKIIRSATIGLSLNIFCKDLLRELADEGYEVVALSSPDEDLREVEKREKVRAVGVQMERRMSPLKDIVSLVKLVRVFAKEKPDMVHSMTPKAGLLCMVAGWMKGVPVRVHTFTGLVWPTAQGLSRRIVMLTDKITCMCATHVVPEGEGVKLDLQRCITKKEMKVLGYGNVRGINMDEWKRRVGRRDGLMLTFVFVGRIVRDKGVDELVAAFVKWIGEYSKTRLLLVGPYEEHLNPVQSGTKFLIDTCECIEAVGAQKDVRPFYEQSDVLVFPSYREGFPNVVIEAGAMELPSIVTDINGSREIIEDGRNGLIVPARDEQALFEAMKWMVEHDDERNAMAAHARPMIASRYEQGYVRGCLKNYYKEIFARNCGSFAK